MKAFVVAFLVSFLSFTVSAQQPKSQEELFVQSLYAGKAVCAIQTSMAQTAGRLSYDYQRESFKKAASCILSEQAKAEDGYKAVSKRRNPKDIKASIKNVYAKWLTVMDRLYTNEMMDQDADREFESAANLLMIDLKSK